METEELPVLDSITVSPETSQNNIGFDSGSNLCCQNHGIITAKRPIPTVPRSPYRVTKFYDEHIRQSEYYEQLRRIVKPSTEEISNRGDWDTSGEHVNTILTGFQHKYRQTGLILVTDRCFCYCRFCFRKRFVGVKSDEVAIDYPAIAAYIRQHPEISNVLLTGGDPLICSSDALGAIVDQLLDIPHVCSIRFGTKATVFYPKRFSDTKLIALFEKILKAGKTAAVVTHIDHVGEISAETQACVKRLRSIGMQLFNQTVLLNQINVQPDILARTFQKLHQMGIRPYYLFQARPVRQGSHFQVPLDRGISIVREVNRQLNGIEKTFRYVMSHRTGKIEILGLSQDERIWMRYHQCVDPGNVGLVFSRPFRQGTCWLDDLTPDALGW
ncbi:MAG: hypothetical protein JW829_05075 [Pirellulales bacterium]|nr:hypothetical protein [Pirellulales bacterium]